MRWKKIPIIYKKVLLTKTVLKKKYLHFVDNKIKLEVLLKKYKLKIIGNHD